MKCAVSTGVRVLLRRHVLQHNRADQPDERRDHDHAQEPHEPDQRAEEQISRSRRPAGRARRRVPCVVVTRAVRRFPTLDRYRR